jgi:hypothetical protein
MTAHEPLALDYPREHVYPPEESSMSNKHQPPPPPTQFGVFYPLGHVVVALESREDADRMRQQSASVIAKMALYQQLSHEPQSSCDVLLNKELWRHYAGV